MVNIIDRLKYYKATHRKTYDELSVEIGVSRRSLVRWLKGQIKLNKISRKHKQRLWRYWRERLEHEPSAIEQTIKTFKKTGSLKKPSNDDWISDKCLMCGRYSDPCPGFTRPEPPGGQWDFDCCYFKEKEKNEP